MSNVGGNRKELDKTKSNMPPHKPVGERKGVASRFSTKKRPNTHKRVNSRRKGIVGELEARDLWREFYPGCQRSFGQARKGYEQPDLIGGGIEKKWYIEVKRPKLRPTERQAEDWLRKLTDDCEKFQQGRLLNMALMYRPDGIKNWVIIYQAAESVMYGPWAWSDFRKEILCR